MSALKKLALIAVGYALSVIGGVAVVAVHELFVPADVAQNSGGMAAFGDMILFVLVASMSASPPGPDIVGLVAEVRSVPIPDQRTAKERSGCAPSGMTSNGLDGKLRFIPDMAL
jgi:hypothetical protein